ncbi:MAG: hypothetical protein C6Y22_29245 [Hapalosiphonaceae cyanobacterium JJU2]|nr:MAG: hypothetical protein C6Y22_29245 [Hapalosiphonaceae cyanobacterium JJU2]
MSIVLTGLRHFLAPKGAENPSQQGKEVDDLKMPETLVTTGFMPIPAKTATVARFEAIFGSVFV